MRLHFVLPLLALAACGGEAPENAAKTIPAQEAQARTAPDGKPIRRAIAAHLGRGLGDEARLTAAWADLNNDGKDEAVVYLVDPMLCGSGGCNTYVLAQTTPETWRVVSDITVSRLPIYRLAPGKDGWVELGVTVSGGGLARMVMAVPHGDAGYARNPTVPPAKPIDPRGAKVLIEEPPPIQ
jgi:hypothetical protein